MHLSPTKRIVQNTIILYIRMFAVTLISLYTSRVVLQALGVEDFGVYNITGGLISFFAVINTAMSSSTQRFLNIELGQNNYGSFVKVFNIGIEFHIIIALLIFILGETVGLYIYFNLLNIPDDRIYIGHIVYQLSLLTTIVTILKTPYNALIIAKERMAFFACISISEAVLKLIIVLGLSIQPFDNLIIYATGILIVNIILLCCMIAYSRKRLSAPHFSYVSLKSDDSRQMLKFSTWNLIGNICNVSSSQGLNILLNVFYGVTLNAAVGITNQVTNTISAFTLNFQVAYKPAIIQYYVKDKCEFARLVCRSAKYSFFLLFLILYPLYFNVDYVLHLWLGKFPDYSNIFIKVLLFSILVSSINVPFYNALEANGKIAGYQFIAVLITPLMLIYSYVILRLGFSPEWAMLSHVIVSICLLITSFILIYKMRILPLKFIMSEVVFPIVKVMAVAIFMAFILRIEIDILDIFIKIAIALLIIFCVGMSKREREGIVNFIIRKI